MAFVSVWAKRDLSIQFNIRSFKGIKHDNIIDEIKKIVEIEKVKSIQFTENNCIVSLQDNKSKEEVLVKGITLNNRSVSFYDVEQNITNVTIKDLPYELDNQFVYTQMIHYGKPIPNSIRRGLLKGTNIENGSRYIQIMECDKTLPNRTSFGRFPVRIFADNNRTVCQYCQTTDHPSYMCKQKPDNRRCYNCFLTGHIASDCKNEPLCKYCKKTGHNKFNCEELEMVKARREYGDYAHDILDGRRSEQINNECSDREHSEQVNNEYSNIEHEENDEQSDTCDCIDEENKTTDVTVILGASNTKRLGKFSENVVNASVSGAGFASIGQCIELALTSLDRSVKNVKNVLVCLGTNDVTKNRDDCDQVNITFSHAISAVAKTFPDSRIGVTSVLPRKGRGQHIMKLNEISDKVNRYVRKWCAGTTALKYIDTVSAFSNQGSAIKNLYDANDPSGVHISNLGQEKLCSIFTKFISSTPQIDDKVFETPREDRKRGRSKTASTPSSADRKSKQQIISDDVIEHTDP